VRELSGWRQSPVAHGPPLPGAWLPRERGGARASKTTAGSRWPVRRGNPGSRLPLANRAPPWRPAFPSRPRPISHARVGRQRPALAAPANLLHRPGPLPHGLGGRRPLLVRVRPVHLQREGQEKELSLGTAPVKSSQPGPPRPWSPLSPSCPRGSAGSRAPTRTP
jgi:hypothetical protein